jgi:hypothetical protein
MVDHLPSICKTLGSSPDGGEVGYLKTKEKKKKRIIQLTKYLAIL